MTREPVPYTPLEWPRRLLVVGFVVVSVWYLAWRVGTLNPQAPIFSALVYGAELFGFGTALLHIFMCWRLTERIAPPPPIGLSVDVFVPTYNESVELVRKTLLAARAMDYPHKTWLLDDGRRPEMEALARQLGCGYLARADNEHAKAGNLNHALAHSSGEFVVVFDADHAPRRDFLVKTLGYFDDEDVAFVQTPQDFYNLDSYQHRWRGKGRTVWTEQSLFFRVIQRGKDYWNAAFFCGSCAVVRRSALDEIGGFATGTVTEDLHTSLRLHARGLQVGLPRRVARLRPGARIDRAVHRPARALGPGRDARLAQGRDPEPPRPHPGAAPELPGLGADLLRRLAEGHLLLRAGGRAADRHCCRCSRRRPSSCCTSFRTTC